MSGKPLFINGLTKVYGNFTAVDQVKLEVEPGEVFGFLGPNGAGKSTTIRTILNFIKPTDGSIKVFGQDSVRDSEQIKHSIGYLAGDIALYDKMTGWQVFHYLSDLGKNTDWKYVDDLIERLQATPDRIIGELSKGNKQKIGLIQAFMHQPDLLVLDEPTSGLDPLMKQVFYDMVLELKTKGKTVFVSSHDLTEVQKICDRAAFIRDGKLIAIENVKDAKGLHLRRFSIEFADKKPKSAVQALGKIEQQSSDGKTYLITVTDHVDKFVKELAKHEVVDLDEQETTIEDLFMNYYGDKRE